LQSVETLVLIAIKAVLVADRAVQVPEVVEAPVAMDGKATGTGLDAVYQAAAAVTTFHSASSTSDHLVSYRRFVVQT